MEVPPLQRRVCLISNLYVINHRISKFAKNSRARPVVLNTFRRATSKADISSKAGQRHADMTSSYKYLRFACVLMTVQRILRVSIFEKQLMTVNITKADRSLGNDWSAFSVSRALQPYIHVPGNYGVLKFCPYGLPKHTVGSPISKFHLRKFPEVRMCLCESCL